MNGKIACLIIAVLVAPAMTQIGRADCTGCSPGLTVGGTLATDSVIRYGEKLIQPKIVLEIRSDGTIIRKNRNLYDLDRAELLAVVRELIEVIQKGK